MEKKELIVALRHPEVKKEISRQIVEVLDYRDKKEKANSKQAAKREKRG